MTAKKAHHEKVLLLRAALFFPQHLTCFLVRTEVSRSFIYCIKYKAWISSVARAEVVIIFFFLLQYSRDYIVIQCLYLKKIHVHCNCLAISEFAPVDYLPPSFTSSCILLIPFSCFMLLLSTVILTLTVLYYAPLKLIIIYFHVTVILTFSTTLNTFKINYYSLSGRLHLIRFSFSSA